MSSVALKSALEDFEACTLGALPRLLGKVHYLAELHDGRGNYDHWGMGRVYGEDAARRAMRTAHGAVMARFLRTPLRELAEDLAGSASALDVSTLDLVIALEREVKRAMPAGSPSGSEKHFMAVLHALAALAENRGRANHPGASQPLRPDR